MGNCMQHGLTTEDKHACRKTMRQIEESQKIKCEDTYNQIKTLGCSHVTLAGYAHDKNIWEMKNCLNNPISNRRWPPSYHQLYYTASIDQVDQTLPNNSPAVVFDTVET